MTIKRFPVCIACLLALLGTLAFPGLADTISGLSAIPSVQAPAGTASFQTDYEAIDQAAKSVLMLNIYDASGTLIGTGSGFVAFDSQTLVTNYHIIEKAQYILAVTDEGYQYLICDVLAGWQDADIAILRFYAPTDRLPLSLATGTQLLRGQPVVAIGSPMGVKNTVSLGNISALVPRGSLTSIQFTAPISSGSSGGALFDDQGRVIGMSYGSKAESQNMNLAIQASDIVALYKAAEDEVPMSIERYIAGKGAVIQAAFSDTPATVQVTDLTLEATSPTGVHVQWETDGEAPEVYLYHTESGHCIFICSSRASSVSLKDCTPGGTYTFVVSTVPLSSDLTLQKALTRYPGQALSASITLDLPE